MTKIHVAHILTQHKFEAEDLQRRLQRGEDFGDLAKKYSLCSSAKSRGDLGSVDIRKLDPDFLAACTFLASGEISSITRTKFGYHLIKMIEKK